MIFAITTLSYSVQRRCLWTQTGWLRKCEKFLLHLRKNWSQMFIIKRVLKENIFSYPAQLTPASSTELEFYYVEKDFMVGYMEDQYKSGEQSGRKWLMTSSFQESLKISNHRHIGISVNAATATKCSRVVDVILSLIHIWAGFRYLVDSWDLLAIKVSKPHSITQDKLWTKEIFILLPSYLPLVLLTSKVGLERQGRNWLCLYLWNKDYANCQHSIVFVFIVVITKQKRKDNFYIWSLIIWKQTWIFPSLSIRQ